MLAGCHGRLLSVHLQPREAHPKQNIVYSVQHLENCRSTCLTRVDAWHSPGSIEIPSDEITKQPAATPDEVTRIEGQERVPSVLSDPPRSDSIRFAAPRRNLDLDLKSSPNLVLPLAGSGKTKAPR